MRRTTPLRLEPLEDRSVPAVFGTPWPDALHLTVSFAPDGAVVGPAQSELYSLLDASGTDWQREILRAFQTWVQYANLNVALVPDSGDPLGTDGIIQGDPRFGDARLAAYALSPEVVAVASPFDLLAGTWAGDIKLNSTLFGPSSTYDLYSVLMHEIGHFFGLDHSEDPDSALFENYLSLRTGLTAEDVARLQELYGVREPDAFDAQRPNDTLADAATLSPDPRVPQLLAADGDLTTAADLDWYQFRVTGGTDAAVIRLRVSDYSLLSARLSLYDSQGRLIQTVSAGLAPGQDLEIRLENARASETYYLLVEKANDDFAVGAYRLEVELETHGQGLGNANGAPQTPRGDDPAAPVSLQQRSATTDARFDHVVRATLYGAGDVDYYRVHTPQTADGSLQVMTVLAWGLDPNGPTPQVRVLTAEGVPVAARVLVNEDGSFVLQLQDVAPGSNFLIEVTQGEGGGAGEYFLGVDFGGRTIELSPLVADRLWSADAEPDRLQVTESQLFHFLLSAAPGEVGVRMEVFDQAGQRVATLEAAAGSSASTKLFLRQGEYTFRFFTLGEGAPTHPLTYSLLSMGLSNPIGPALIDPTLAPFSPGTDAPTSSLAYLWQAGFQNYLSQGGTGGATTPPPDSGTVVTPLPPDPPGDTAVVIASESGSPTGTTDSGGSTVAGKENTTATTNAAPPPSVSGTPPAIALQVINSVFGAPAPTNASSDSGREQEAPPANATSTALAPSGAASQIEAALLTGTMPAQPGSSVEAPPVAVATTSRAAASPSLSTAAPRSATGSGTDDAPRSHPDWYGREGMPLVGCEPLPPTAAADATPEAVASEGLAFTANEAGTTTPVFSPEDHPSRWARWLLFSSLGMLSVAGLWFRRSRSPASNPNFDLG